MGTGWQLAPPREVKGKAFDAFKSACANFVGFRDITALPYTNTLRKLAEASRPPGDPSRYLACLYQIRGLLPNGDPERETVDAALAFLLERQKPTLALTVRQPHAEAIMRGVKPDEHRTRPTHVRGRVFIYAALSRDPADDEAASMKEYGIRDVTCDQLPRGVLIGTVELFDCEDGHWHLRDPQRAGRLRRPKKQPQPAWFRPF